MSEQTPKEKFEEQLQAMCMLQNKVRRNPIDNASWKELHEGEAVLEQLYYEAYSSLEVYQEELHKPVIEVAQEWGIEPRKAMDIETHKRLSNSFFDLVNGIRQTAIEDLQLQRERTRDISLKKRYAPSNVQPIHAATAQSAMKDQFHAQTPDGKFDSPLRIKHLDYGNVSIGGFGTGRYAHFIKVSGIDTEGRQTSFVLSKDDLEHRSLDQSPQNVKKLEVGDMIAVSTRPPSRDDYHQHIPEMKGLHKVQSLFLVTPAAFFDATTNGDTVIDGVVEEYGKIVLHGDWPTRQVTISDASGNKGTFILPGNADYDRPTAKEGERIVGAASRDGRLSAFRPL